MLLNRKVILLHALVVFVMFSIFYKLFYDAELSQNLYDTKTLYLHDTKANALGMVLLFTIFLIIFIANALLRLTRNMSLTTVTGKIVIFGVNGPHPMNDFHEFKDVQIQQDNGAPVNIKSFCIHSASVVQLIESFDSLDGTFFFVKTGWGNTVFNLLYAFAPKGSDRIITFTDERRRISELVYVFQSSIFLTWRMGSNGGAIGSLSHGLRSVIMNILTIIGCYSFFNTIYSEKIIGGSIITVGMRLELCSIIIMFILTIVMPIILHHTYGRYMLKKFQAQMTHNINEYANKHNFNFYPI